jgi:hypothetical protein
MARFELQIFGDESTATGIVSYGLIVFANAQQERRARYAWQDVLRSFGAPSKARVHARTLFSGQARRKTEWSHLDEASSSKLALRLIEVIKAEKAFFSVGVAHTTTWPETGIPDGVDENGNQRFIPITPPTYFCYAFLAAVHGLDIDAGKPVATMPHKLFLDPLSNTIRLFSDWNSIQATKLMQQSGLTPSRFEEKPQFLDAADIFAYAAARALSEAPARNKQVCADIYKTSGALKTDMIWNPDGARWP